MTVEEVLKNYLETQLNKKVFPLVKPQNESLPCIVYQRISTVEKRNHSGKSNINRVRMQLIVYGNTYSEAKDLANQVKNLLEVNTTQWKVSTLENQIEFQTEVKQIILDFYIWSSLN